MIIIVIHSNKNPQTHILLKQVRDSTMIITVVSIPTTVAAPMMVRVAVSTDGLNCFQYTQLGRHNTWPLAESAKKSSEQIGLIPSVGTCRSVYTIDQFAMHTS